MAPITLHSNARVLLVVEGSAACPMWPAHLGAPPEDGFSVLEQEEWESMCAFGARLEVTLGRATSQGDGTFVVALVTSGFWDPASLRARRRLALDILAHLAETEGSALLLTHGHQHDAGSRDALGALAAELAPDWADARVTVSARLEERARRVEPRKASSPALVTVDQLGAT
ncbi:MAG TPA: hypothetical protein VH062_25120 [Polyangiaceae bacterium]|jgi:hypothetical protein|nr:hypothetical protein [Polyangiaceae bacterium]